jgi:competence protein CoiA
MKFALVNGNKVEATKGDKGLCPSCGSELIAKCGEVKINHWAHKGSRNCDPWWENETDWHRSWKDKFPIDWQEVVHFDESGEKHIADVKTQSGYVLEFQHSYLNPEERRSRNAFYPKLVWVVDGTRRKTDKKQFQNILNESTRVPANVPIIQGHFPDECRLLKEWHDSNVLVFFDFQEVKDPKQSMLWFLFPKTPSGDAYLSPFSRVNFIELHNNNKFDELVKNTILPINKELARKKQIEHVNNMRNQQSRSPGFERHMANIRRRRKRF